MAPIFMYHCQKHGQEQNPRIVFIGTIGLSLCQRGNCSGNVCITPEISDGKPHKQQQDKNPDAEKQPYAYFRRTATTLSIAIMMMFFVFHNRKL